MDIDQLKQENINIHHINTNNSSTTITNPSSSSILSPQSDTTQHTRINITFIIYSQS